MCQARAVKNGLAHFSNQMIGVVIVGVFWVVVAEEHNEPLFLCQNKNARTEDLQRVSPNKIFAVLLIMRGSSQEDEQWFSEVA